MGPVKKFVCPNCRNEDFWELDKIVTWITLFFVPVIPYRTEHRLGCPICRVSQPVESPELEEYQQVAAHNLAKLRRHP